MGNSTYILFLVRVHRISAACMDIEQRRWPEDLEQNWAQSF